MNNLSKKLLIPLAFTNIYVLWGLTFIAISYGLQGFPPFILSGLRFLLAGLLIFAYRRVKGEKMNTLSDWKKNSITGIFILTGGTGLVSWGEQYVSAPEAAIAIATGPFWFIVIDKRNWKKYFSNIFIITGLITGFAGLIYFLGGSFVSLNSEDQGKFTERVLAFCILALSSVFWVLGSLYSKHNPGRQSTVMNIAQQLISAGVAALLISLIKGEWRNFSILRVPEQSWLGLLYLIFLGSIMAYLSYIWLLSVQDAALVSTHTYINPIVTVIAGWYLSDQAINNRQVTGLFIILSGVLLTNMNRYVKLNPRSKVKLRRLLNHSSLLWKFSRGVAQT